MRIILVAALVGTAVLGWTRAVAQQVLQPQANSGSGVVTIEGAVRATQVGDWSVSVANAPNVHVVNTPSVALAPPEFLRLRGSYELTWPDGSRESIVVQQIGRDGWVRVEVGRWVNVLAARSVKAQ
jgi:hypothetical protein